MERVSSPDSSAELVARWRQGDQQAATILWRRYAERLMALTRRRLSGKLSRYLDPEDVVQSAYRSFFAGARSDRYVLRQSGALWRLLVAITLHKLDHQVKRYHAEKRSVVRDQHIGAQVDLLHRHIKRLARQPSPDEAAALTDEVERVMRSLVPLQRQMVQLRLQGYRLGEIAETTGRSERTVRRVLERVERKLKKRCAEYVEQ